VELVLSASTLSVVFEPRAIFPIHAPIEDSMKVLHTEDIYPMSWVA